MSLPEKAGRLFVAWSRRNFESKDAVGPGNEREDFHDSNTDRR